MPSYQQSGILVCSTRDSCNKASKKLLFCMLSYKNIYIYIYFLHFSKFFDKYCNHILVACNYSNHGADLQSQR